MIESKILQQETSLSPLTSYQKEGRYKYSISDNILTTASTHIHLNSMAVLFTPDNCPSIRQSLFEKTVFTEGRPMFNRGQVHVLQRAGQCFTEGRPMFYRGQANVLQRACQCFTEGRPMFYRGQAHVLQRAGPCLTECMPMFYRGHAHVLHKTCPCFT